MNNIPLGSRAREDGYQTNFADAVQSTFACNLNTIIKILFTHLLVYVSATHDRTFGYPSSTLLSFKTWYDWSLSKNLSLQSFKYINFVITVAYFNFIFSTHSISNRSLHSLKTLRTGKKSEGHTPGTPRFREIFLF